VRPSELTGSDAWSAELAHDFEIASTQHGNDVRAAIGAVDVGLRGVG
jgi:hypothetical protein